MFVLELISITISNLQSQEWEDWDRNCFSYRWSSDLASGSTVGNRILETTTDQTGS